MLARALRAAAAAAARAAASPLTAQAWTALKPAAASTCFPPPRLPWRLTLRPLTAPAVAPPPARRPRTSKNVEDDGTTPQRGRGRPRVRPPRPPPRAPRPSPPPPPRPFSKLPPWQVARAQALAAMTAPQTGPKRGKANSGLRPRGTPQERKARSAAVKTKAAAARATRAAAWKAVGGEPDAAPIDSVDALETAGTPCVSFAPPRPPRPRSPPRGRARASSPPPPRRLAPAATTPAGVAASMAVLAAALPPGAVAAARNAFALPGVAPTPRKPPLPTAAHLAATVAAFLGAGGTPDALATLASREPAALARADASAALAGGLRALAASGVADPASTFMARPRAALAPDPGTHVRRLAAYLASLGVPDASIGGLIARAPVLAATPLRHIRSAVAALSGVAGLRGPGLAAALAACPGLAVVRPAALRARARWAQAVLRADAAALAASPSVLVRPLAVTGGRRAAAAAVGREAGVPLAALGAWTTDRFAAEIGVAPAKAHDAVAAWAWTEEGKAWLKREGGGE